MDFLKTESSTPDYEGEWYESEDGALARVKEARKEFARSGASRWAEKATESFAFTNGDQWSDEEKAQFNEQLRPSAVLNWVQRIVNAICGQEVANRQEPRYLGREEHDFAMSDVATSIARWVRERADEEDEDSQAFRDLVIAGMGWTARRMEYDVDPEGKIVKERMDPRRFRWDANARRKNLADARWVQCDYRFTKEEIEERWGEVPDISVDAENVRIDKDKPHDATNDWKYQNDQAGVDQWNDLYRVVHHVEWCRHAEYQVLGEDGNIVTMDHEQFEAASERAEELGMPVPQHAKRQKRVYYSVWTVGNTVLEHGPSEVQTDFVYQCMTGIRDDDLGYWTGVVEPLKDPQRVANKLFITVMHTLNTNAKGGLVVESDAVDNKRKFEETWAKADAINWVKPGTIAGGKIMPKTPPAIPPQISELMQFVVTSIPQIAGANPEMLGQATEGAQPGVVEAMRTKAGLIVLAPWFDAKRLYTKRDGRLLAEFIAKFISDGRKVRIVGEDGMQNVVLDGSLEWLKFDVIVDESTQSRDVKDRTFMALMQLAPAMAQFGFPPPPDALEYAPLPQTLVQKWQASIKEKMSQPPQPSEKEKLEQVKQQGAMQQLQAKQQADAMNTQLEMQQAATAEAMQAETQERIEAAKVAAKRQELDYNMHLEQFKTTLDARLTAFEAILKGMLELKLGQQQMEMEREQTIMEVQNEHRAGEPASR